MSILITGRCRYAALIVRVAITPPPEVSDYVSEKHGRKVVGRRLLGISQ